jgi:hypothetical protein
MGYQGDSENNYEVFRECVSRSMIERSNETKKPARATKRRKVKKREGNRQIDTEEATTTDKEQDPEELADFIDVLLLSYFPFYGGRSYNSYFEANIYVDFLSGLSS